MLEVIFIATERNQKDEKDLAIILARRIFLTGNPYFKLTISIDLQTSPVEYIIIHCFYVMGSDMWKT